MFFFTIKFSLINLIASWSGAADIHVFRVMRTLRGLRPLRALSRIESMKVRFKLFKNKQSNLILPNLTKPNLILHNLT